MTKQPQILGLIPARGGSKGIPGKNIKLLAGKPLIAWTIETALASGRLDRLVVSTDSPAIAEIAQTFGAEAPFLRPAELAQDSTPGMDVIIHTLDWLADREDYHPAHIMLLQPTSPLRSAEDISEAIRLAQSKSAEIVLSVVPSHYHPFWARSIAPDGRLTNFLQPDKAFSTRQSLPPAYALNGAIYLARADTLRKNRSFDTDGTYAYIMPPERSLDIDTPWDFHLAELILKDREA